MKTLPQRARILVCPDSFKGSLSAPGAAAAIARGARRALPRARITVLPLADGGEGTLSALHPAGGTWRTLSIPGPLSRPVRARYLLLPGRTAVIEMAQAAGLTLVPRARRDPGRTTTLGVGILVADAVARGCRLIAVTLGGSATVDGGAGMARALGARLMDRAGRPVPPGGAGLLKLATIDARPVQRLMRGVRVVGLTDVRNPLLGRLGAARVFGPQKGATPSQVRMLERGLSRFAAVCRRDLGRNVARIPGAGAAGGLGAGLAAFLDAKLESGADWIFRRLDLDSHLGRADLVLTGEGSLDEQTRMGKLVARVAARARRSRVPVIAFAGRVKLSKRQIGKIGLMAAYGLAGKGISTGESFSRAAILLERRVFEALRLL